MGLVAKGKSDSLKSTCREMIIFREARSKQRYPLWLDGYPRKIQGVERGASLCGVGM